MVLWDVFSSFEGRSHSTVLVWFVSQMRLYSYSIMCIVIWSIINQQQLISTLSTECNSAYSKIGSKTMTCAFHFVFLAHLSVIIRTILYQYLHFSCRFDDTEGDYSMNSLRLSFDNDLMSDLYRHWNLYDSLSNSIYTAAHFKVWSLKGKSRFHEFLAVMGYVILCI